MLFTTNPDLATIPKLFKLSANISAHGYCLTPLSAPVGNAAWDLTFLSDAEMVVWKVAGDLSDSGGGLLLDLAGTLNSAVLPPELRVGMQIRLDKAPPSFLVGVKHLAIAIAAIKVVVASSPEDGRPTISPGKHDPDTNVVRKAAGCVVEDLNGDLYTLRNKALSAEKISRVGGALRECGSSRLNRLMSDLNFVVNEFKGLCLRQSCRTHLPIGDDMLTFSQLKSVMYLDVWLDDDMFAKCFLGLEDGLDWSVSLANFVKEDKCLWGGQF